MTMLSRIREFRFKRELFWLSAAQLTLPILSLCAALAFPERRALLYGLLALGVAAQIVWLASLYAIAIRPLYRALLEAEQKDPKFPFAPSLFALARHVLEYYAGAKEGEYATLLLQKQAEIAALQSQINPHFLHNTLDSIRGLAMEENAHQTCDMVGSLSRFLRYTIGQKSDMISLNQELDSVKNYMNIQRYRFADRFSLKVSIEPEDQQFLHYCIPKLTLQPLIENAIYHGLNSIASGGLIEISCTVTPTRLILMVSDNGVGIPADALAAINARLREGINRREGPEQVASGVALYNVNARIKLVYGERYGLTLYSLPNVGTQVEIALPLREGMHEI